MFPIRSLLDWYAEKQPFSAMTRGIIKVFFITPVYYMLIPEKGFREPGEGGRKKQGARSRMQKSPGSRIKKFTEHIIIIIEHYA